MSTKLQGHSSRARRTLRRQLDHSAELPASRKPVHTVTDQPYTLPMRVLHWTRAGLILGLIALGWIMTSLSDDTSVKFEWMYPVHKQFGVLAFIVGAIALIVRLRSALPPHPADLNLWEKALSHVTQLLMLALAVVVPLMGYGMSSSYSESDGVPFFFVDLPELLAKNDTAFVIFAWAHKISAYTLLALITLHVIAVVKHRFFDRGRNTDVLSRMI